MKKKIYIYKGDLEKEYTEIIELKKNKKKDLIFGFLLYFSFSLLYINVLYIGYTFFNTFFQKLDPGQKSILLFFVVFLSFNILFYFVYQFRIISKENQKKILELSEDIKRKKEGRRFWKKKLKPIEALVKNLKYKINIKNLTDFNYNETLNQINNFLKEKIFVYLAENQGKYEKNEELDYYLSIIFDDLKNGNHTKKIIEKLNNKKDLLNLLFYIYYSLQQDNKDELIFINLKKKIESRFHYLERIEKKEKDSHLDNIF